MATLKFGNGNWATKEDSVLAYNDENNNFKPLPFDFTRASTATYVDSDGLIKTARNGEARIDYKDSTDGALLLEPSRSNNVDNSTNFFLNSWGGTRVLEGSTITSPNGNNEAHKLIATSVDNTHYRQYTLSSASAGSYTGSCFFKKGEFNVGSVTMSVDSYANRIGVYINLDNGTHLQTALYGSPTGTSYKIEDYGNGWYRLSVTIIHTSGDVRISLSNASSNYTNNNGLPVFLGNSSDGGYSWGAQLEAGSYPTSYIPTSGSAVTRVADACSGAGNEQVINSSEGVLFADIAALDSNLTSKPITINDTTSNNELGFYYYGNRVDVYVRVGGLNQFYVIRSIADATITSKIALKYKENDFALWINGIKVATDTSGNVPTGLSELAFKNAGGTTFYGKTKDLRVYNTALTDAELATLTT